MRLCLDVTSIGVPKPRWTGVARMSWELSQALARQANLDLCFSAAGALHAQNWVKHHLAEKRIEDRFIGSPLSQKEAKLLKSASGSGMFGKMAEQSLRIANFMRQPIIPAELRGIDAFFSFYAGIPRQIRSRPEIRCGLYVHDLIPFLMPEHCSDKQRSVLRRVLRSIQPDDLVVVNSEQTRRDLVHWLGCDSINAHVIPLAADPLEFHRVNDPAETARVRKAYKLPTGRYFLSLHNAAPHKNMHMLIRSHAIYRQRLGSAALPLVIAGGKGDPRAEIATRDGLSAADLSGVRFLGFVDQADLAALYSNAQAFFFPSLYEGFGLPVLEALFCGTPVFVAKRASLPEILAPLTGSHAGPDRLLPAEDISAWVDGFARAADTVQLSEAAIKEAREHYSWNRSAARLRALLQPT